jgi:hypothetical protein
MDSMQYRGRAIRHVRAVILIPMIALGACLPLPDNGGEGYEPPAAFCGVLYACGSHNDRDRGSSTAQNDRGTPPPDNGSPPPTGETPEPEPPPAE